MDNIFLFLSMAFLLTFLIGRLIEKIRVPWIFGALIVGSLLALYNPFAEITSSATFGFLSQLGMYFLLFIIGFEIDLKEMKKKSSFIVKSTFFIILLEAIIGTVVIYFVFGQYISGAKWLISFLVALSFATVGEAVLIPILDEFKIVNSHLGQTIIGIGLLDDIIEIFALISIVIVVGSAAQSHFNIALTLVSLLALVALAVGFNRLGKEGAKFNFSSIETLFLLTLFVLFLFLGIGKFAESTPLAALLAGTSIRTFIPSERLKLIESEIRTMCYGFFAPLFFLGVGVSIDWGYLLAFPLLVLLVVAVSNGAKLLGSYIATKKEFGTKKSLLLGIGLSVRFSTSIVIIKILFDNQVIGRELYSVIIASAIVFTFLVPVLFSNLLTKWNIIQNPN